MYSDRTDKPESPDLYRLHTSESRESIGRSSRLALFGLGRPPLIDGLFFGDGMRIPAIVSTRPTVHNSACSSQLREQLGPPLAECASSTFLPERRDPPDHNAVGGHPSECPTAAHSVSRSSVLAVLPR